MGEAAKLLLFEVSTQVVMSFCVAGVALCDSNLFDNVCQNWRFAVEPKDPKNGNSKKTLQTA